MKALDTNVLIRFLVRDDEKQAALVLGLFKQAEREKQKLFVPILVVLEMIWVLESVYTIPGDKILDALQSLLLMPVLSFDVRMELQKFIQSARGRREGLADLLIAHTSVQSGCECVLTFDKKASGFKFFQLIM
jgi:predicted nucleic-acid-binding protein